MTFFLGVCQLSESANQVSVPTPLSAWYMLTKCCLHSHGTWCSCPTGIVARDRRSGERKIMSRICMGEWAK